MNSIRDIIAAWPSRNALAADLGIAKSAVDKWHERERIPGSYDLRLVAAARQRGIEVSLNALAEIRAKPSVDNYHSGRAA